MGRLCWFTDLYGSTGVLFCFFQTLQRCNPWSLFFGQILTIARHRICSVGMGTKSWNGVGLIQSSGGDVSESASVSFSVAALHPRKLDLFCMFRFNRGFCIRRCVGNLYKIICSRMVTGCKCGVHCILSRGLYLCRPHGCARACISAARDHVDLARFGRDFGVGCYWHGVAN